MAMTRKATVLGVALAATAGTAEAQWFIQVFGTGGTGFTFWSFSGVESAVADGTLRTNATATFLTDDTGQFPFGQNTILNPAYDNTVVPITGDVTVTTSFGTESVTGLFFDDDGLSADDFGIRVANPLSFTAGEFTSIEGDAVVNVDISDFALGNWSINDTDGQAMLVSREVMISFEIQIPAPGSGGVLAVASLLGMRRRRAGAMPERPARGFCPGCGASG